MGVYAAVSASPEEDAQMTSPFILGLSKSNQTQNRLPVAHSRPVATAAPVGSGASSGKKPYNPFLSALDTNSPEFREMYGVNRPFAQPAFLGYRDNQPIYGGSRLFILY
jgi:hypothetical protein